MIFVPAIAHVTIAGEDDGMNWQTKAFADVRAKNKFCEKCGTKYNSKFRATTCSKARCGGKIVTAAVFHEANRLKEVGTFPCFAFLGIHGHSF
jgi:hypothetical protein